MFERVLLYFPVSFPVLANESLKHGILQAVLPLRGKILNIERKDEAAMYKNEEIQNLILGLGLGVKVLVFRCYFVILCRILRQYLTGSFLLIEYLVISG